MCSAADIAAFIHAFILPFTTPDCSFVLMMPFYNKAVFAFVALQLLEKCDAGGCRALGDLHVVWTDSLAIEPCANLGEGGVLCFAVLLMLLVNFVLGRELRGHLGQ